ncbi:MAG: hypothetical protein Q9168_007440 [Polycauliona sp. 1 TL-2023]
MPASTKARSTSPSVDPVSSRTRASPSNGLTEPSSQRSASASRTPKTSPTPPRRSPTPSSKLPTSPPKLPVSSAIKSVPSTAPAIPAGLTPRTDPGRNARARLSIRREYRWEIPLDTGCAPYITKLPLQRRVVNTVGHATVYGNVLQSRKVQLITNLKIALDADTHVYSLQPGGKPFPFRGQGPIWDQNSCHLDVCIVAARLLNVGLAIADKGREKTRDSWLRTLPPVQQKFLDLIAADWEGMDKATNIDRRHAFWDDELAYPEGILKRPALGSASNVWNRCTSGMGQFGFEKRDSFTSCKNCGKPSISNPPGHHQYLSLDMAEDEYKEQTSQFGEEARKPLEYWLDRALKPLDKRCGSCRTPDGRSHSRDIVGGLPQRLVVVPGPYVQGLISAATSDYVHFSYWSANGEQKATYRWLGGIYHREKHFRLYWTDSDRISKDPCLKVYDGLRAYGSIIGGIPAFSREDKVPPAWSRQSTILFYERVDKAALETAAESVRRGMLSTLSDALRAECIGAQVPDGVHTQPDESQDSQAAVDNAKEEEATNRLTDQEVVSAEKAKNEVPRPGSNNSKMPSDNKQPEMIDSANGAQPDKQAQGCLVSQANTARETRGDAEDQEKSDKESLTSDPPEDEVDANQEQKEGE